MYLFWKLTLFFRTTGYFRNRFKKGEFTLISLHYYCNNNKRNELRPKRVLDASLIGEGSTVFYLKIARCWDIEMHRLIL